MNTNTTKTPVTVPMPSGPAEGMSVVAWLAIGTGTALAMMISAWGIKRLIEREASEQAPDSLFVRPRF